VARLAGHNPEWVPRAFRWGKMTTERVNLASVPREVQLKWRLHFVYFRSEWQMRRRRLVGVGRRGRRAVEAQVPVTRWGSDRVFGPGRCRSRPAVVPGRLSFPAGCRSRPAVAERPSRPTELVERSMSPSDAPGGRSGEGAVDELACRIDGLAHAGPCRQVGGHRS